MIKIESFSNLLKIENDVIVERLKGLTFYFNEMIGGYFFLNKFQQECQIIRDNHEKYFKTEKILSENFSELLKTSQGLNDELVYVLNYKKGYAEKVEKAVKLFNDRLKIEQEEKGNLYKKNEEIMLNLKELEKQNEVLNAEIHNLRKNNRVHVKGVFDGVCKNCKKIFNAEENFNWSCKTHLSGFNGTMYWCCGKTEKNAAGCIVTKHISETKEEPPEDDEKVIFCSVKLN
jgi:hypothetical protein